MREINFVSVGRDDPGAPCQRGIVFAKWISLSRGRSLPVRPSAMDILKISISHATLPAFV